jgi:myo-inositol 2-dehydrogenase/D-chiro-inositol 1-dehydrogenase
MAHFVDALKTGARPMCSVQDGLCAQLIVEAAVESMKTNRPARVASIT